MVDVGVPKRMIAKWLRSGADAAVAIVTRKTKNRHAPDVDAADAGGKIETMTIKPICRDEALSRLGSIPFPFWWKGISKTTKSRKAAGHAEKAVVANGRRNSARQVPAGTRRRNFRVGFSMPARLPTLPGEGLAGPSAIFWPDPIRSFIGPHLAGLCDAIGKSGRRSLVRGWRSLAIVSREPGQALTGAAISGVALCEGRLPRTSRSPSRSCGRNDGASKPSPSPT